MFLHYSKRPITILQGECVSDCRKMAYDLYRINDNNYPLIWAEIGNDREKLATIFEFFCFMQNLLRKASENLMKLLHQRLSARRSGGPPSMPYGFEKEIEFLSTSQMKGFDILGVLVKPAFELFASGALSAQRKQIRMKDPTKADGIAPNLLNAVHIESPFEPDGPAFFYWAEFAFLSAYSGFNTDKWKEILLILIPSEKIFALTYGKPVNGQIPEDTNFSSYRPDDFSAIHPKLIKEISFPAIYRFDRIEGMATDAAMFAFPGGVD